MDVDSVAGMPCAEIRAEYLHVSAATVKPCQYSAHMLPTIVMLPGPTMLSSVNRTMDSNGDAYQRQVVPSVAACTDMS